jgi:hypothetical protein
VEKLEDDFRTLQREMQTATLNYLDVYAKAKKLFGRIAKAQDRAEQAEQEAVAPEADNGGGAVPSPLSARAQRLQHHILARRARLAGKEE